MGLQVKEQSDKEALEVAGPQGWCLEEKPELEKYLGSRLRWGPEGRQVSRGSVQGG